MAMDTMLATNADAQLILKLYELRTEQGLRSARKWIGEEFWPTTAEEFFAVWHASGTEHNAYLRQVLSYWEMAGSFVLHGALDADLFFDCNGENLFLLAKFHFLLGEIRKQAPGFLKNTEELTRRFPAEGLRLERMIEKMELRREKMELRRAAPAHQ
jgi:hypothetical protein